MSYFLWVEDFASVDGSRNIKGTADKLFGGIYPSDTFREDERDLKDSLKNHNIFLELTFQDAIKFINTRLNDIDYVVLDIDLPAYGECDEIDESVLTVLREFEGYTSSDDADDENRQVAACNQLKKNAGFYLYSKLVLELGFPIKNIKFFSNHGNEAKTIEASFISAKITPPEIHLKSDDGIRKWISDCYDSPYSTTSSWDYRRLQTIKDVEK
jgi:hypothetical protein